MDLVVAGFGSLTDEVLHGQCAVEESSKAFDWVRDWDCNIVKLKSVGGNAGQFLSPSDEHCFYFFAINLVEVCFISSSCWCPNNSEMWFSEKCGCFGVRHCRWFKLWRLMTGQRRSIEGDENRPEAQCRGWWEQARGAVQRVMRTSQRRSTEGDENRPEAQYRGWWEQARGENLY